ncbi:MAG: hypothetical protein WC533_00635 [Candidatus Pacearchaeota archaeon]
MVEKQGPYVEVSHFSGIQYNVRLILEDRALCNMAENASGEEYESRFNLLDAMDIARKVASELKIEAVLNDGNRKQILTS